MQGRQVPGATEGHQGQSPGQLQEESASLQGSMEGSALRAGLDQDAESSVNSLLGPALGESPLLLLPPLDSLFACSALHFTGSAKVRA